MANNHHLLLYFAVHHAHLSAQLFEGKNKDTYYSWVVLNRGCALYTASCSRRLLRSGRLSTEPSPSPPWPAGGWTTHALLTPRSPTALPHFLPEEDETSGLQVPAFRALPPTAHKMLRSLSLSTDSGPQAKGGSCLRGHKGRR